MSNLVTIFGGSGFVGRYVARRMAHAGWRVRVAVRRPNEANFVRTYGVVGQVDPVFCNIRDDDSVQRVVHGADAVVNCVGILAESGKQSFDAVQTEGAGRIARIAAKSGVARMVHVSAIGADADSDSGYARSKAAGEAEVLSHMPDAMILRPSVIFGPEDEFFNRFAGMTRFGPILPLIGADTRFQPVYVDDVAHAAELGVTGAASGGIYELGGPDVLTLRELMAEMLEVIQRRRLVVNVPFPLARLMGSTFDMMGRFSGGLISGPVTRDQVTNLAHDNVVGDGVKTMADLGIFPTATDMVLPEYLWRFRHTGQYAAIKDSARTLRRRQE